MTGDLEYKLLGGGETSETKIPAPSLATSIEEAQSVSLSVRPLGESFAAEISGLDVSKDVDSELWSALYQAFLDYKVVAIRSQSLTAAEFHSFGERFGPVEPHTIAIFRHPDREGITLLSNRMEMGRPKGIRDAGSHWHSDYSYKAVPSKATLLYALEIPAEGGDTLFADLQAAYEALPSEMKRRAANRFVRHQYRWSRDPNHPEGRWKLLSRDELANTPEVIHPLIRIHPETGAKSIFAFPGITSGVRGIIGLSQEESDELLESLYRHCTQPQFQIRYRWQVGDVVLWDNRGTMHCATTDSLPPDRYRTLWRINTTGSIPEPA